MIEDQKIRNDMMFLLGQIHAACFPLCCGDESTAYHDLMDSIKAQYVYILERTIGYEES